ncbi:GerW family sporulation protein [Methanobrevibacter sp.]
MSDKIKTTVEELRKLISVDNVIGKPIETEDKLLIPVMKVGVGFGVGTNIGSENTDAAGAGAGVEPISMVMIPKKGNDAEGVRVLDLSKGSQANKAITDIGLVITDLVKNYLNSQKDNDEYYDESEYIEPEFITNEEEE